MMHNVRFSGHFLMNINIGISVIRQRISGAIIVKGTFPSFRGVKGVTCNALPY